MVLLIKEIVEKIFRQPGLFDEQMAAGRYCRAKWTYINTVFAASFIEMDQEAMDRLKSMFCEERVKEAFRKAGGPDDTGCRPRKEDDPAGRHIPASL